MADRLSLEPADAADFEALVALRIAAMRDSLERVGRFDPARARERFREGFSPAHTQHILIQGQRAGFFVIKPLEQPEKGLLLDHLYIHPHHQSRGVGSQVLARVFSIADSAQLPLRVGALRGSDSNRFYLRHGFKQVEEAAWDNYYVRSPGTPSHEEPSS